MRFRRHRGRRRDEANAENTAGDDEKDATHATFSFDVTSPVRPIGDHPVDRENCTAL
jgi:hypothetical protein